MGIVTRARLLILPLLLAACGPWGSGITLTETPGRKIVPGIPIAAPNSNPSVSGSAAARGVDEECVRLAGPRRSLEASTIRLRGTIRGENGSNALIGLASGRDQVVRVGEYIGSHCWRVKRISLESISLELIPRDPDADHHTATIEVNDGPHSELAGLK